MAAMFSLAGCTASNEEITTKEDETTKMEETTKAETIPTTKAEETPKELKISELINNSKSVSDPIFLLRSRCTL